MCSSGGIGVDLGGLPTDTPIGELAEGVQGTRSSIEGLIRAAGGRTDVTIADFIRHKQEATRIVGAPEQVVDELERWQDAGVDGINLQYLLTPGSFSDFADHVVPELRARGLVPHEPVTGTLRDKLTGKGDQLPDSHPARRWRGAFTPTATKSG
ncbi:MULTISPECIES: LLM class oxidoreductase [Nocardia]|uniref:hypothetical protein n=1 Tax=Nocardia TaxID=1817 RepID=UPI001E4F75E4|nr:MULTISPECIES: hypothetical protein [Nocardia]